MDSGTRQLTQFAASWPEGFYSSFSKHVVTFSTKKKRLANIRENAVVDQAIYARVIGILLSQRDLDIEQVLVTEMADYTPSMFDAEGQIGVAIQVEMPTAIVMDVRLFFGKLTGHLIQLLTRLYHVSMCGFLFGCWSWCSIVAK